MNAAKYLSERKMATAMNLTGADNHQVIPIHQAVQTVIIEMDGTESSAVFRSTTTTAAAAVATVTKGERKG